MGRVAPNPDSSGTRRLAFVVNHAAFFVSHRLPIALEAVRRGWQVELLTGQAASQTMESLAVDELSRLGIRHFRYSFGSSGLNPIDEIRGFAGLVFRLRSFRPDIVHCASPIGLLYGGLAARLAGSPALVLAVSGMGYAFTDSGDRSIARTLLRSIYLMGVRFAYRHPNKRVIVQNVEDRKFVLDKGLASSTEVRLIRGSGVDLSRFDLSFSTSRRRAVVFLARLLRDKGVIEFVEAARRIREAEPDWTFVLAGTADYRNPSSIPPEVVSEWVKEGVVEWRGHVSDIATLLLESSIVCLPSYREGMPKALLEAAAAGCAVVTTDAPGCRDAVIPGVTGEVVPVRDVSALTDALLGLIRDQPRREAYGREGRALAMRQFGLEGVLRDTFEIYDALCDQGRRRSRT